jgi:hypothetical protein
MTFPMTVRSGAGSGDGQVRHHARSASGVGAVRCRSLPDFGVLGHTGYSTRAPATSRWSDIDGGRQPPLVTDEDQPCR